MKKRFSILSAGLLFIVALFLGAQLTSVIPGKNILFQVSKFSDVLSNIEKFYVDTVNTQKLVESAISGMLSDLDPHSVYLTEQQNSVEKERFEGSFQGIGVEFDVINDTIVVVAPVAGGPSDSLGILAGDKIVKINDTSSIGMTREMVPKKLKGPKGTHVKVTIFRSGEKDLTDYDITRDNIPIYTIDVAFMVKDDIGYISVNRFASTTHNEFMNAVGKLKSRGMKRLVLDLRSNPGGYLDQAFKMADELLPQGKKVVYTKGRRPEFSEEYVSNGGQYPDVPLVVLVSHGSASASEIVSGAIQDWDRGLIVGETTYGKGLVQRQYDLQDKSAFRLTIARYYTPSGRLIQRPYGKNIDEYNKAAFDRNEAEGENIEHKEERDSAKPIFKTASGRTVYGGGGITPDYIVKSERPSTLLGQLFAKSVFAQYKTMYMDRIGKQLRRQYEKNFEKFRSEFSVSNDAVKEFMEFARKKGITQTADEFEKDKAYIRTRVKADVARDLFGNEGWYPVMRAEDVQVQKALTLFPEAEKIAGFVNR